MFLVVLSIAGLLPSVFLIDPINPLAGVPRSSRLFYHDSSAHVRLNLLACSLLLNVLQATMGVRLPTILGKAIDDTIQTLNTVSDEVEILDLVACVDLMGE